MKFGPNMSPLKKQAMIDRITVKINDTPRVKRAGGNSGTRDTREIVNTICTFDIEATNDSAIAAAYMYVWKLYICGEIISGRTWEDYRELMDEISMELAGEDARMIIFVHNLSYEFQFLKSIFDFSPENVMYVKSRKILKATWRNIEYRCSYLLSNMSLAEFTRQYKVEHAKLSGDDYNYGVKRYPWTPLTADEEKYGDHDVVGLAEAIEELMSVNGDTLITLPLTSTGFVRRDAKRAMHSYRARVKKLLPDINQYIMLREAFRGGNCHANRYYAGRILCNVYSDDRSSSYPDEQINGQYPIAPFEHTDKLPDGGPYLARICLSHIRLRDRYWGFPYIPIDKCRKLSGFVNDNGRVLSADYLEITVTDIDMEIISRQYSWDRMDTQDVYKSQYGKLPQELLDCTIGYYRQKTELKGVVGEEVYYVKSKNKLNSIYGMMAQNPAKPRIIYDGYGGKEEETPIEQLLLKSHKKAFLPYQWGVWVTAHARYDLEQGLILAGDNGVYTDTDSVKSVKRLDYKQLNDVYWRRSMDNGAYAIDNNGIAHCMGVYEPDGVYDRFVTWGAKKYCYEQHGALTVVVSGVSRKYSSGELARLGGIEAFRPGLVFVEAGGLEATYNDTPARYIDIDGHKMLLTSNLLLTPSTYKLGITKDYEKILEEIEDIC